MVHVPIVLIGGTIGIYLFYVQHQFEDTYWSKKDEWNVVEASLEGSSFFDLPKPLHWITGNIGYHHIHHLASRIPFYKLPKAMGAHPAPARGAHAVAGRFLVVPALQAVGRRRASG